MSDCHYLSGTWAGKQNRFSAMMNSCDKSSAFSLDPHVKAVSYFNFRLCISSHMKQKIIQYFTLCHIYTIYVAHLKKWNRFTFFFVHLILTPVSLWIKVIEPNYSLSPFFIFFFNSNAQGLRHMLLLTCELQNDITGGPTGTAVRSRCPKYE